MKLRSLSLVTALTLSGCIRNPPPAVLEDDRSIVFPSFFEREAIEVGARGGPYELDGVTLRALIVVANDFLPPGASTPPCRNRQEAQRYRLIRQGDIIFVSIRRTRRSAEPDTPRWIQARSTRSTWMDASSGASVTVSPTSPLPWSRPTPVTGRSRPSQECPRHWMTSGTTRRARCHPSGGMEAAAQDSLLLSLRARTEAREQPLPGGHESKRE